MLKSESDITPAVVTVNDKQAAKKTSARKTQTAKKSGLLKGTVTPTIFTGPFRPVMAPSGTRASETQPDQEESSTRRAHRERMKDYFTRTDPAV